MTTTLTELLKLDQAETAGLRYDDVAMFCKELNELLDRTPPPVEGAIALLSRQCGLTPVRTAQAAAWVLRRRGEELLPRRWFGEAVSYLLIVLFVWSAWYWRPAPASAGDRVVVVAPRQTIAPFMPIRPDQLTMAAGLGAGIGRIDDVVGRYATKKLPAGTAVTVDVLSAASPPDLGSLSLISLNISNLPATLTDALPLKITLAFSPKPQSNASPRIVGDLWLVAEERSGAVSRITVAAARTAVEEIGTLAASCDASLLLPR